MNDIQLIVNGADVRTDSRDLASLLDHRHRAIFANIKKYERELGALGQVLFEKALGVELPQGGRTPEQVFSLLNEDQCYFVLTLMRNNERVVAAKLKLVQAFRDARTQLANRDIARLDGKAVRKAETGAIADLVEYAKAKGSRNADMYFANVTKMTNKLLGIESGQRDLLNARQLNDVAILERIVANSISDGIAAGMDYKEVFQLSKARCGMVLPAIGINSKLESK